MLHAIGWVIVAPMVLLCATQWLRYDGDRYTAALQALFPWATLPAAPLAVVAMLSRQWWLVVTADAVIVTLVALARPILRWPASKLAAADPTLTVVCANLLAYNPNPVAATLAVATAAGAAEVLVMIEPTPALVAALSAALPAGSHPYRTEVLPDDPSGLAVWSRVPFASATTTCFEQQVGINLTLHVGRNALRLVAAHPYPPTLGARAWQRQLREFERLPAATAHPLLVVGDFNAARWHPSFRRLLCAGFVTAHETLGHGWRNSWPAHRGTLPPPFVRLDHALAVNGVVPVAVRDVRIPGSDHIGFVASFTLTAT